LRLSGGNRCTPSLRECEKPLPLSPRSA
jgi:hypothetical protein